MTVQERQPSITIWTIAALAALAWALIALAYASLAPSAAIPRIFQNYHVEHFAAFYVVTVLAAAALPGVRLRQIATTIGLVAIVFAAFRLTALVHKLFYAEDLVCDLAGVAAALAPIFVGRFRQLHLSQSR